MRSFVFVACVAALLTACLAPIPTQHQIESTDVGPYPSEYQQIVKDALGKELLDPYSAVYSDWKGPQQGYAGDRFTGFAFGWRVCVSVNAKNRMGGYVGARPYAFVIRNGAVVKSYGGGDPNANSLTGMMAQKLCEGM
jgi:hypothetical protein